MILKRVDDEIIFVKGKHRGESLSSVAESDITYLKWVFKKASTDLADDVFHALEDVMEEKGLFE